MGHTAEEKTVTVKFTKSDATKLVEQLIKAKEPLAAVTDSVGTAQVAFLNQIIGDLQAAVKKADDATAPTPPAPAPAT